MPWWTIDLIYHGTSRAPKCILDFGKSCLDVKLTSHYGPKLVISDTSKRSYCHLFQSPLGMPTRNRDDSRDLSFSLASTNPIEFWRVPRQPTCLFFGGEVFGQFDLRYA